MTSQIENNDAIIEAFRLGELLKTVIRYKAASKDEERESVAEHSFRVAFVVMILCDSLKLQFDTTKAIKIALVHDLVEAITDDIDYILIKKGKLTEELKLEGEIKAIAQIENSIGGETGANIRGLWEEYEFKQSAEGLLVRAIDKMEAMSHLMSVGLENCDHTTYIPNYADSAVSEIPELGDVLKRIKEQLKVEFEKNKIPWLKEYD